MNSNEPTADGVRFRDVWATDLREAGPDADWLWHGYLADSRTTLLTSPAKSGKTTLLAVLLKRMETGGELAGLAVRPGVALVVTEEARGQWWLRDAKLHFGTNVCWQHRPFGGRKPQPAEWDALIGHILDHRDRHGTALAVIDTIAHFLPARSESEASCVMNALFPLQRLTDAGMAVLLLHHPRKQSAADGQWARGSTTLVSFADFVIEMHLYAPGQPEDRRRTLVAGSRFEATPPRRVIELDAAGTDYQSLGNLEEAEFHAGWEPVRLVLAAASRKLTRREITAAWPPGLVSPNRTTLWRWLEHAVGRGLAQQDGAGTSAAPFRFWLPDCIARWQREGSAEYQQQREADEVREMMRKWNEGQAQRGRA